MKTLNKILAIGALALASLTECTRMYNIEGKTLYYNEGDANPMVILSDSSKIVYQTKNKNIFSRTTGKDISEVRIAKVRKPVFAERMPKYSYFPKTYSQYNKKDSAVMSRERKNFDYYLIKIDSIEKSKKVK